MKWIFDNTEALNYQVRVHLMVAFRKWYFNAKVDIRNWYFTVIFIST